MKKIIYVLAGLAALAAPQAYATDGIKVSAGLLAAQGNSVTLTRKVWGGYTYEVGYLFTPADYGASIMPYVGWGRMPGSKNVPDRDLDSLWGPNTYGLTSWRAGFDVSMQPVETFPLRVVFGPSLHSWQMDRVGIVERPLGDFSVKLGWRVGLEYPITPEFSACLYFTQSEWRGIRNPTAYKGYVDDSTTPSFIDGLNPSKPAYISIMGRYTF